MTEVASKNLYALLGNTSDQDSDREPEPPVKVVDKTPARTDKRNAPRAAPSAPPGAGNRRGDATGNEGAFRDRNAGRDSNQERPVEEAGRQRFDRPPRAEGTYQGRGGRGARRARGGRDDRHSRGLAADSEKQANHGWGSNEPTAELADEQAAETIAKVDEQEAWTGDGDAAPVNGEGQTLPEVEAEDTNISYADYLIQQAEKKLALNSGALQARKPNEGSKEDKKWANAKALSKEDEEAFISGSGGKAKRERERKQKQVVEIDQRFVESADRGRGGFRGGRGRGRGDGSFRGRGDGSYRGRGDGSYRGRGDGAPRGAPRGGPRGGASLDTEDPNAFPSLGS